MAFASVMFTVALVFYILTWLTYPKNRAQDDVVHGNSKGDAPISGTNMVTVHEMCEKKVRPTGEEHTPKESSDGRINEAVAEGCDSF